MPVTVLDLAIASNTVYNYYKGRGGSALDLKSSVAQARTPPGYHALLTEEDANTGFLGAVYKRIGDTETIIACRGTVITKKNMDRNVGMKNVVTDIGLYAIESLPSSMGAANDFVTRAMTLVGNDSLILCGHSLGGAIATILAFQRGIPCCAFNAPTVSKMINGGIFHGPFVRVSKKDKIAIERKIINFNLQWDPISKSSQAVGKVIKLPASIKDGGHSQDKVVENLKSSVYGSKRFADLLS